MLYFIEYECELKDFNAWAGAYNVHKQLSGKAYEIAAQFVETWKDVVGEIPTDEDINDWLWFDCEDFLREEYNLNLDGTPYSRADRDDAYRAIKRKFGVRVRESAEIDSIVRYEYEGYM